jgi:hypothetical protein
MKIQNSETHSSFKSSKSSKSSKTTGSMKSRQTELSGGNIHQTMPVIDPDQALNVDLLISSMKILFKELNPQAKLDEVTNIF